MNLKHTINGKKKMKISDIIPEQTIDEIIGMFVMIENHNGKQFFTINYVNVNISKIDNELTYNFRVSSDDHTYYDATKCYIVDKPPFEPFKN